MDRQMDNQLTKAQWIAALRQREDAWAHIGAGQEWLGNMMEFHTPDIADDTVLRDITAFLGLLDRWAVDFAADKPHTRCNRPYIHSEWLEGHPSESITMAMDLAYTCARIGGPDLGIAVGAHVLGGWYQLSRRCDDFTRVVYEPLRPYIRESENDTAKLQCGQTTVQINLCMMGRTIVIIDKKGRLGDADAVHLQLMGPWSAEGVKDVSLHLVDAPTLGAALSALDEVIAYMDQAPNDPDSMRAMLSEGRLWVGGVFTHI